MPAEAWAEDDGALQGVIWNPPSKLKQQTYTLSSTHLKTQEQTVLCNSHRHLPTQATQGCK